MVKSVNSERLITYESWDLINVSVPARSLLYNLEPIGTRTGLAESLTSYAARLAAAHCLSPAVLLGRTLAPLIGKKYWLQGGVRSGTRSSALCNSFSGYAKAVNGIGVIATDWVGGLESLTGRSDLRFLTMLPWSNVFTQRNLLRSTRAWCPNCYEDWLANDQSVYEPLLWTFRTVEVCLHHQRRLRSGCEYCGHTLSWLSRSDQPGYCSKCRKWLGSDLYEPSSSVAISDHELAWHAWVVKNLEQTILAARHLPSPPKERTSKALAHCIDQATAGIMNRFASLIGKRKNTVWGWQHGKSQIPIDDLLQICWRIDVPLVDFLYSDSLTLSEVELFQAPSVSGVKTNRKSPRPFDRERTERNLQTMLTDHPPLTMEEVALRLKFNKRFLYKHFPALCKAISARRAKHQAVYYTKRQRQYRKDIRHVSGRLRATGIYPSRRRVVALITRSSALRDDVTRKSSSIRDIHIAA